MVHPEQLEQAADAAQRASVALLSFVDDGTIVHANEQLHHWLGCEPGSLIGLKVDKLLSPSARIFYTTHFFPLLKLHGKADEIYLSLRTHAGADLPVMASGVRQQSGGKLVSHCALMTIWRRKEFETALVEARKEAEAATNAKDEFLAMVSHELRTPLSAILGWVRLAQTGKLDPAMHERALQTIERSAQSQSQLIEDLLDISRIVSGRLRLSPRAIDLTLPIEAALDTARPAAQAKGITLLLALDRAAGIVYADPDRLQQIVWNLVSNAIKFTPKGGRVQVTLSRFESRVRLEVSDSGEGVSAQQLPYLFDRFWQGHSAAQREQTGLGLGLPICKKLVELHGGSIQASSAGPGEGSTFTVELPLAVAVSTPSPSPAHQTPDQPGSATPLEGLEILVVDDDADSRALLQMLLCTAGAEVATAASCDEALAVLQQRVPNVLLSDVGMPGKDGYELIRQVRASADSAAASVAAIAITGLARPQDRVNLLRAGFQAHLCKPVEPAEVVALVGALAGPRQLRS